MAFWFTAARMRKGPVDTSVSPEEMVMRKNINGSGGLPRIFIPDVLANWPWTSKVHPDHVEIEKEAAAWFAGFQDRMFSPEAQEAFNRTRISLLPCMLYPNMSKESVKRASILGHLGLVVDEFSDKSTPSEVCDQEGILLDAILNPDTPRPKGEWMGGEMARQIWQTNMRNTSKVVQKKFLNSVLGTIEGMKQESIDRQNDRILDIQTYLEKRTSSFGAKAMGVVIEVEHDIPKEIMTHPAIQEITLVAGEIAALCNDMVSYNVEQMRGEFHNIIPCVMKEHNTDVNGAMLWVRGYISRLVSNFLAAMTSLPELEEPLNSRVKKYCDGMGQMVRGNYDWCFETERYLGNKGPEIKKTRWMSLLQKQPGGNAIGPVHVDSSLL